ncbi:MAG: formate dehydrogenase subunit delta [Kineosporiaceae bacterium]
MSGVVSGAVLPEVRLANDIARQFAHLAPDAAAKEIAAHLASFWDPRMRARLESHAASGGESLDPLVLAALTWLAGHSKV